MPFTDRTRRPTDLTPMVALQMLREGNYRFVNNQRLQHNLREQADQTREQQLPFAAILSCMDSRTAAELIFDQGLGDIFSIRIAGNVITDSVVGSLEYATAAAGSKLILVMGHTNCGAVAGAIKKVELGKLSSILHLIDPAVEYERAHEHEAETGDFTRNVSKRNAIMGARRVYDESDVIRDLVDKEEVAIVPAMYDLYSGVVQFFPVVKFED
ncbi:MAG: carbonic anhydrase [Sphingobacteriales bacterium]|nr:MAG: carbonic anhydrase [Sphingobacteriales bacterium]